MPWSKKTRKAKLLVLSDHNTLKGSQNAFFILNTLYFKGKWQSGFDVALNKVDQPFNDDRKTLVTYMRKKQVSLDYFENDEVQLIEIPYLEPKNAVFGIVLPKVSQLVKDADISKIGSWIPLLQRTKIKRVTIPKFKVESTYDKELIHALCASGAESLFQNADFSKMIRAKEEIVLSTVIHKATIEVDNTGTIATAATFVGAKMKGGMMQDPLSINFIADHTFWFYIRNVRHNLVLFMGQYTGKKE